MASLSDLFGRGSIGEQLLVWGALNQIIGAAIAPGITEISQEVNSLAPLLALSPSELAAAVNRGYLTAGAASGEASKSGIDSDRFKTLVDLAGTSLAPDALVEALRRQIIPEAGGGADSVSFDQGVAEGNLHPKWTPVLKALSVRLPSIPEVMQAWLEGQIDQGEALTRYTEAGGDPTWFQTSYNAQGSAPTPMEALEMLNRGLIPEDGIGPDSISYNQAFLEGPWRNKWLQPFLGLRFYVPPPRTVTAMLKEGSLTTAEATAYLMAGGLSQATATQYISAASHSTSAAAKELAQSTVLALYEDKLITQAEAVQHLTALKYSQADATLLLAYADLKAAHSATNSAVTHIRTLYLNGQDDAATAKNALHSLGLTDQNAADLMSVWDIEKTTASKSISAAEVASALFYNIIDQPTAQARLVAMGYTAHDAWVTLSVRSHGALPDEPGA